MQPSHSTDPQLGPALALVALRTEFPQLPTAAWHISTNGHLSGTVHDPDVFAAYVEVLGGTPMARFEFEVDGTHRAADNLFVTWRDVEIALVGQYVVEVAPALSLVAVAA